MLAFVYIVILSINSNKAYANSNNILSTAKSSNISECILFLYILVFYTNDSKSLKSITGVSIDIDTIYFRSISGNTYTYGTVYYKGWSTCRSEYSSYRLLCLMSRYELTVNDFRSFTTTSGAAIACNGNSIDNQYYKFSYPNYWGCAIMGKSSSSYYTGVYKSVSTSYKYVLDISNLAVSASYSNGALMGIVKYKKWDNCIKDSVKLKLKCIMNTGSIGTSEYISSTATKYPVNCSGNNVVYHYSESKSGYLTYYGCALINNYNVIYDYENYMISEKMFAFDISHLNVVSHTQFTTISGTVYYPMFHPCSIGLFKLVCILTNENPTNNDFLKSNNELFDVKCSGTYITSNIYNNTNDEILSCGIIDETRTYLFVYEIYNSKFEPKIDLKEIKMKNNRTESIAHIKGTIKYKNWVYCSKDYINYRLKCYGSYDEISKSDLIKGDIERINCDGNNIDMYVKGNGKSVYFGCGITTSNGITIYTYEIKKFKIKLDLGLLFRMLGYALLAHLIPLFILLCVACR